MNRHRKIIPAVLLAAALLTACTPGADSSSETVGSTEAKWNADSAEFYDNRVTIINRRGCDLYAMYLSPSSEEEWSENVIGEYELPDHGELTAEIPVSKEVNLWDIRLEDRDHEMVEICEKDLSALTGEDMVMELAIEGGDDIVYVYQRE